MYGAMQLASAATLQSFRETASNLLPYEACNLDRFLPKLVPKARMMAKHWDFFAPTKVIDAALADEDLFPHAQLKPARLRRATIATIALNHLRVDDDLPASVISLYPDWLARLARYIATDLKAYDPEYYAKDLRYALGLTLPCGALQFDAYHALGPKLILHDVTYSKSLSTVWSYTKAIGVGRWYNVHIDLRTMRDFNPAGWTRHCKLMAEVLNRNRAVRGVLGVGWFYDPALEEISPEISYIQKTQTASGAFLIRVATEPHHIENALFHSARRKRLYDEGKYVPVCYGCAWPRSAIIKWASEVAGAPRLGFEAFASSMIGSRGPTPPTRESAAASAVANFK